MKMILTALLSLILFLVLPISWCSWPWSLSEKKLALEIINIETEDMVDEAENPTVIKVLTWNLGFLYGKGSEGPGYEHREKGFYEERLNSLVRQIEEWGPDVLFLQEVDFDSSRSHHLNQARFLAAKAGYPYVAEAVSWEANYIPFPYWPLKNNFGSMRSGGAILSRYPLSDHEVILMNKPQGNPWWYNLFYLHRYLQKVTLTVGEKKFRLINLHLEAFDKAARLKEVEIIRDLATKGEVDLVAGDFNMLPASATRRSKFETGDDYENDPSYEAMMKSGLLEVVPDEIYAKSESTYFTFPAWAPDRRLDYIFYQSDLKMMKAEVLPSALSDHLPMRASFQIDSPKVNPYSL